MFPAVSKTPTAFKISRGDAAGTGRERGAILGSSGPSRGAFNTSGDYQWLLETALISVCFFLYAGQPAPDVNESHYLTKAKHFWDATYCPGDLFLGSAFSHWLFYVCFGWLTKFMSLTAFAWTGRILTWTLMAFAWQRLSQAIVPLKFMSVLSALFFLLLNDKFHLAGEWVVGGFEAKGIAYFFVIYALSFLVRGNWKYVWPLLGAASAFHVLVGGWAVLACMFASIVVQVRRSSTESTRLDYWKSQAGHWWLPLMIGGVLALPGILPPLIADAGASAEAKQLAAEVYVGQRISHHLNFAAFPTWHVARFGTLVLFWGLLYLWLKNRLMLNPVIFHRKLEPLQDFATGALLISFCGLLLSGLADTGSTFCAGLLKFYWFRLADFAVPATISLASCFVIAFWLERENDIFRRISSVIFTVCIFLAAGLLFLERHQTQIPFADVRSLPQYPENDQRFRESWKNWVKVCQWVESSTPADAVFLTPYQQQTFKWYALRTEVVSWKDIPQDAESIVQWHQRLKEIQDPQQRSTLGLLMYTDDRLAALAEKFEADFLVLPQAVYDLACNDPEIGKPRFPCVYPEEGERATWVVLKLQLP
ncbi:DUF6798 domain-containing protein [Mariniblastus fucicola]|uniref:DUF6798 domain-containing protein n=1 Tax=Mariniblastus fucicola TaxID=980251 RepID=A0A5B9PAR0_9BACT|nr:DUF6798 domain-containing protein [Mariniblastus fucicola]QEG23458.1 hypothetical protein MFFC18_33570 [Mariniblastus fucicola]